MLMLRVKHLSNVLGLTSDLSSIPGGGEYFSLRHSFQTVFYPLSTGGGGGGGIFHHDESERYVRLISRLHSKFKFVEFSLSHGMVFN